MFRIRSAEERGKTMKSWLDSRHTFAFGRYEDPEHQGFRCLRALNDERVAPDSGVDERDVRNMEVLSYVVEGKLGHRNDQGYETTLEPGDLQRTSAGRGMHAAEFNPSDSQFTRFLQIWIAPNNANVEPECEEKHFDDAEARGGLQLLATPHGEKGPIHVNQDVRLYRARLGAGESAHWKIPQGRYAWVQVIGGDVTINDAPLSEGDGLAVDDLERELEIIGQNDCEILLFDLP